MAVRCRLAADALTLTTAEHTAAGGKTEKLTVTAFVREINSSPFCEKLNIDTSWNKLVLDSKNILFIFNS